HQNFAFEVVNIDKGIFKIINRQYFSDTDNYAFKYYITENGKKISEGDIDVSILPQQYVEKIIPITNIKPKSGYEYFINFEVTQKEAQSVIPAGYTVAIEQFKLPIEEPKVEYVETSKNSPLKINDNEKSIKVSSSKVNFEFDKTSGIVTSY